MRFLSKARVSFFFLYHKISIPDTTIYKQCFALYKQRCYVKITVFRFCLEHFFEWFSKLSLWHCGQNCGQNQMRSAHKQKNPTISNVKSFYFLSECNYRIWKKPVISMVLGQQARGFYPKNQFPYPFLLIWFCMPEYLLFSPNEVCYQEAIWYL